LAVQPSNPLDYAGSAPVPASTPVATPAGGILTIGPTTYAVASIGAVQVQTDLEPREFGGWLGIVGCTICLFALLFGGLFLPKALYVEARPDDKALSFGLLALGLLLLPSFWVAWALRRETRYQVALFVDGIPHIFLSPDQASAFRLRDQIVAAMSAGGGTVYVDARQVHVHKHA
jgi:hypothetical protein